MPTTVADVVALLGALQGRWIPVYQEIDGQAVPKADFATTVVEIQSNEFKVIKAGTVAYDGLFTLDPLSSPNGIALIYKKSTQPILLGGARPGVFQIEGDTLKWCFGAVGQSRPEGLNTFPGAEAVFSIYQREGSTSTAPGLAAGQAAVSPLVTPHLPPISGGKGAPLW
jgi:uncharacterized protein (TIGR03067 family)